MRNLLCVCTYIDCRRRRTAMVWSWMVGGSGWITPSPRGPILQPPEYTWVDPPDLGTRNAWIVRIASMTAAMNDQILTGATTESTVRGRWGSRIYVFGEWEGGLYLDKEVMGSVWKVRWWVLFGNGSVCSNWRLGWWLELCSGVKLFEKWCDGLCLESVASDVHVLICESSLFISPERKWANQTLMPHQVMSFSWRCTFVAPEVPIGLSVMLTDPRRPHFRQRTQSANTLLRFIVV